MQNLKFSGAFLLLITAFSSNSFDFSRINMAWKYDPQAEIEMSDRVVQNEEEITVFLRFRAKAADAWNFEFWVQQRYNSESHTRFKEYELDTLLSESDQAIVKLTFQKPEDNLLVVKIFKEEVVYFQDISLKNGMLPYPNIYPIGSDGLPVFENYLNSSSFSWSGTSNPHVMQYEENFSAADPPMGEMKALAPSIYHDTAFVFTADSLLLIDNFYVVREDSNASTGVTILRTTPYFPEFKRLDELAFSMQYILNEPEKKGMFNSRNLKQSFDSFWINTYVTKFRARNAIRNYFNWIKQANRLFTDFKQGWKTDRGMLFIVYGPPDEVYRTDNQEEWYYDNGPSFEYTVFSTFFSPKTYALRRKPSLREDWLEHIAAIRRGSNE